MMKRMILGVLACGVGMSASAQTDESPLDEIRPLGSSTDPGENTRGATVQ